MMIEKDISHYEEPDGRATAEDMMAVLRIIEAETTGYDPYDNPGPPPVILDED